MSLGAILTVMMLGGFIAGAVAFKRTERVVYVACFAVIGFVLPIVGIVLAAVWKSPPPRMPAR